jgi:threonine aldolase
MCNEIAIRLHVRPGGDEIFIGRDAHPLEAEAGGPAVLSGAVITELEGEDGTFTPETLEAAIRAHPADSRYVPRPRLACVEQTANLRGGTVWPLERVRGVLAIAREHGLRTHLDGARLMNAVIASGVEAVDWASDFDTAWIDFTKGLGAPVGACLAGSPELIEEAWRWKQMMGGAMRQSGVIAAAGIYALENNVERLADDHERARRLAEGLAEIPGIDIDPERVETNIVIFEVPDAHGFVGALGSQGVRMGALDARRVRAVTHLDVEDAGIEHALEVAAAILPPSWRSPRSDSRGRGATSGALSTRSRPRG